MSVLAGPLVRFAAMTSLTALSRVTPRSEPKTDVLGNSNSFQNNLDYCHVWTMYERDVHTLSIASRYAQFVDRGS